LEGDDHGSSWSISLFGKNQISFTGSGVIFFKYTLSVKQNHDVSVLLQ